MAAAKFTREKISDKSGKNCECLFAGEGEGVRSVGGKGEDSDGVHEHPEAAGVATVTRKAAVAVSPLWILRKERLVELQFNVYSTAMHT